MYFFQKSKFIAQRTLVYLWRFCDSWSLNLTSNKIKDRVNSFNIITAFPLSTFRNLAIKKIYIKLSKKQAKYASFRENVRKD